MQEDFIEEINENNSKVLDSEDKKEEEKPAKKQRWNPQRTSTGVQYRVANHER